MSKTADAVEILKRTTGIDPNTDPEMLQIFEDLRVAQMICDARTEAGLSQQELAVSSRAGVFEGRGGDEGG